jgi:4-amino-4-deoxy-L-arabinose transferase-like glycosyltransferase
MNKEKIKEWLRPWENKLVVGLIAFTIILRLYYFFNLGNQPIWWDEGDYLAISKVWANNMPTPEWWGHFTGMRPLFMSILWFLFMKVGLGEMAMRFFTLLIPSIITIYLVYAVSRDMYNKKIGLIAGFIMSVYWVFTFYTFRLLTDIPAMCFGMLTIYFFYSRYIVKKEVKGLYFAVLFGVLAFYVRFPYASVLFSCFLFLLITEKLNFFKSKLNWKAIGFIVLLLSPYIIYFIISNFYLVHFYFGAGATNLQIPLVQAAKDIFGMFPFLFGPTDSGNLPIFLNSFLLLLFIGILALYEFFIYLDVVWKQTDKKYNSDLFLVIWLVIQLFIYVIIIKASTDRWLLMAMPPMFILIGKGLQLIYKLLKSSSKIFAIALVVFLVLFGGYYQQKHADWLIDIKKTSYGEIKDSAFWFKQNTPEDTKIITASIVQNQYYSERESYDYNTNDSIWSTCPNKGGTYDNTTCDLLTEQVFNSKLNRLKPDYLVVSGFEPYFQPPWAYTYPQRYNLTLVGFYPQNSKQPILAIYKFDKSKF